MANKIIQMWEESSHTTALYPTSVAEAIKWDSSTTVAQKIASVEDKVGLAGIDFSRVLYTVTNGTVNYTATEDCWAVVKRSYPSNNISIDNNVVMAKAGDGNTGMGTWVLKKGQKITSSASSTDCNVYGLKL